MDNMNEWCVKQHGISGLTEKVLKSQLSLEKCESDVLEFVEKWTPKGKCPLAGNSIGQDAKFLSIHMPKLMEHLHYRVVDVSTIKELGTVMSIYSAISNIRTVWNNRAWYYIGLFGYYIKNYYLFNNFF